MKNTIRANGTERGFQSSSILSQSVANVLTWDSVDGSLGVGVANLAWPWANATYKHKQARIANFCILLRVVLLESILLKEYKGRRKGKNSQSTRLTMTAPLYFSPCDRRAIFRAFSVFRWQLDIISGKSQSASKEIGRKKVFGFSAFYYFVWFWEYWLMIEQNIFYLSIYVLLLFREGLFLLRLFCFE